VRDGIVNYNAVWSRHGGAGGDLLSMKDQTFSKADSVTLHAFPPATTSSTPTAAKMI
jgi:hypothetical protein